MSRPWRIRYAGAKYHVTSRGNGRKAIFLEPDDYSRFLVQLESALEKDEVILYAYCLMPNHYHLFIETPLGNIQKFMQRLNTSYSMYFRYKHKRPGHCLQGRYAAKLVGGDEYIASLTRYIHLNPTETKKMKKNPLDIREDCLNSYPWSSYAGYIDKENAEEIIDYRWLGLMMRKTDLGCRRAYRRYIESLIGKNDDNFLAAEKVSRYAIGDKEFIAEAEFGLKEMHIEKGVYGDIALPDGPQIALSDIDEAVSRVFRTNKEDLHFHGHRAGIAKTVAVELCCVLSGKNQREIAIYYGYKTDGGVARQRKVIRQEMIKNKHLARQLTKLKTTLLSSKI